MTGVQTCALPIYSEIDFSNFDCLHQLRNLYLINNNEITLNILTSKCHFELTNIEILYKSSQKEKVYTFLREYVSKKDFKMLGLNIIKSIHHCSSNRQTFDHTKCQLIPFTASNSNLIRNENFYSFLSVQVE